MTHVLAIDMIQTISYFTSARLVFNLTIAAACDQKLAAEIVIMNDNFTC